MLLLACQNSVLSLPHVCLALAGHPLLPRACPEPSVSPRDSYSESDVKDYLWQMLSATQYLHAQHILHLDLRSENMMVTEYNLLKVVDLGNAQSLSQGKVPPPENFKDYLETMGAYVTPDLWEQGEKLFPISLPSLLPSLPVPLTVLTRASCLCPFTWAQMNVTWLLHLRLPPDLSNCAQSPVSTHAPLQLRNSWKAKGLFHRQTSGLLV